MGSRAGTSDSLPQQSRGQNWKTRTSEWVVSRAPDKPDWLTIPSIKLDRKRALSGVQSLIWFGMLVYLLAPDTDKTEQFLAYFFLAGGLNFILIGWEGSKLEASLLASMMCFAMGLMLLDRPEDRQEQLANAGNWVMAIGCGLGVLINWFQTSKKDES